MNTKTIWQQFTQTKLHIEEVMDESDPIKSGSQCNTLKLNNCFGCKSKILEMFCVQLLCFTLLVEAMSNKP